MIETLQGLGGGDVLVVSHYIAICAAIGEASSDDRVVLLKLANTSITTLEIEDGNLALGTAGTINHLTPEQVTGIATALPGGP